VWRVVVHGVIANAEESASGCVDADDPVVPVDHANSGRQRSQEELDGPLQIALVGDPLVHDPRVLRSGRRLRDGLRAGRFVRRWAHRDRQGTAHAAIDLPLLVDQLVRGLGRARRLSLAEEQVALRLM
jgi:hypothetical protein